MRMWKTDYRNEKFAKYKELVIIDIPTTTEVVQLLHHLRKLRYVSMYFQGGATIAPPRWPIPMYKQVEMSLSFRPQKSLSQNKDCKAARAKKKMLRK